MKKILLLCALAAAASSQQQQSDFILKLIGGEKKKIALPDFRGGGGAAPLVALFNQTVFEDVQRSGMLEMAPKSFYPLSPPQQESDLRPTPAAIPPRRGEQPQPPNCNGRCLSDWAAAPLGAAYLGFGYAAEQNGQFVAFGHLFNTQVPDIAGARLFRKLYMAPLSEEGARKAAHDYAADILQQFGIPSLAGSKIYFVSDRAGKGTKEIFVMDFDGSNQRQLTFFKSISTMPAVSPDGLRVAFTTYAEGQPRIKIYSTETGRFIPFFNPPAPTNATPSFTSDGQHVLYSSSIGGSFMQIYIADPSGANARRLTEARAVEVEPKVNPKTGSDILFVSGRGGLAQIYRMNVDGADVVRVTNGEGEAGNPAWNPNGQHMAFKWTRGFDPGNWNIFVMDIATRETVQLTHGEGKNENPTWAPDGRHIVFSSNRTGVSQIYSMLADGTEVTQLTRQGNNWMPVWSK